MFAELTDRFDRLLRNLRGQGKLTESNVRDTLQEVERILMEADVSLPAARDFIERVSAKAMGREVVASVTPGQMMVKVLYDELAAFLGGQSAPLQFGRSPAAILLVGLNGSGKTTTAAKLAIYLRRKGRRPVLVGTDTRRPAALEQLEVLGRQSHLPTYCGDRTDPLRIVAGAREWARQRSLDCLIVDSAGRQTVDETLMAELAQLQQTVQPSETLLVLDAMTGQDAVRSAQAFAERVNLTGIVLTKLDGDARGGAALSVRWATGRPIKLVGVGERLQDLEVFHPERLAGRILGMGDVVTLVERAQEVAEKVQARKRQTERADDFTLEDFREHLKQLRGMGSLESVLGMIPGMGRALKSIQVDDRELIAAGAIIDSMTPRERANPRLIDGSRRRRIALGSGRSIQEVNRLLNQFDQMKRLMKQFGGRHSRGKAAWGGGFRRPV